MPSKGSPVVLFRCPAELHTWLLGRVEWSKTGRVKGEHTMSSLLVEFVRECKAKRERSARSRKRPKAK